MSAICGVIRLNSQPVIFQTIESMNSTMRCHGSDGDNVWVSGAIGFGHVMSHLTTESLHEIVPCFYPDTKITITADCRLFSRDELCVKLVVSDNVDISDSYLVYLAYLKWGVALTDFLHGEFSIVIWDQKLGNLFCITDYICNRQIYYYKDENIFAFATQIEALHTLSEIPRSPNLKKIANLAYTFRAGYHQQETFYGNIYAMPSASLLKINLDGNLSISCYWHPDKTAESEFRDEDEFAEAFRGLFDKIIRSATRSHLPVASLLSGGLDSSAITAMASQVMAEDNKKLIALSAILPTNFVGDYKDESYYINLLQYPNLTHEYITDQWRGPFDNLEYVFSQPNSTACHYLYQAFQDAANKHQTRIILDGCYGEIGGASSYAEGGFAELFIQGRWATLLRELYLNKKHYKRKLHRILAGEIIRPLLPDVLQTYVSPYKSLQSFSQLMPIRADFINKYIDQQMINSNVQLCKLKANVRENHLNILNSFIGNAIPGIVQYNKNNPVYYSYPYADKRLVEFCLALPVTFKLRHGYKRYPIRRAMRGIVPQEICYRTTKEPFSVNYHERYNSQLNMAKHIIENTPKTALINEIIDFDRLKKHFEILMKTSRIKSRNDFIGIQIVPQMIYLLKFLETFG
jgi:asparagine synthase (glutamine-hydrolysing)